MTLRSSTNTLTQTTNMSQHLFILRSADFQSVADQVFVKQFLGTNYVVTNIVAVRKTGGSTVTNLGGVYPAASKGGTPIVAATQSWLGLSASGKTTTAVITNFDVQTTTPYLSLSTGSTGAVTADVFIHGYIVD